MLKLTSRSAALLAFATHASLASSPAFADGSVSALGMGMGARRGEMGKFDAVIAQYNASGERFRIDSHCQSACTMFLSIRNVCVSPNATLLFHAGGDRSKGQISDWATQHMLDAYNSNLRAYVTANRYMDTFTFHAITGRDIITRFGYPACR